MLVKKPLYFTLVVPNSLSLGLRGVKHASRSNRLDCDNLALALAQFPSTHPLATLGTHFVWEVALEERQLLLTACNIFKCADPELQREEAHRPTVNR